MRPTRGRIVVDGRPYFNSQARIDMPAHRRAVGYVFQDALLFPHLNVARNLRYGAWFNRGADARIRFDDAVSTSRNFPSA